MKFTKFARRMRRHEQALDQFIPPGTWPVVRLASRNFSKISDQLELARPYDDRWHEAMVATSRRLMTCGFTGIYAYGENDDISLLLARDDDTFQRKIRKWLSILAGEASAACTHAIKAPVAFDARLCIFAEVVDIVDYFRWRQDVYRSEALHRQCYWALVQDGANSASATQTIAGLDVEGKLTLLLVRGLNYLKDLPNWWRMGTGVCWGMAEKTGVNPLTGKQTATKRRTLQVLAKLPAGEDYAVALRGIIAE